MGARSSREFVQDVADVLGREPKTRTEIVHTLDCDSTAAKQWLDTLCEIGYAIQTQDGYRLRHRHSDRQVGLQARNILDKLQDEKMVPAYVETEKLLAMIEDQPDLLHNSETEGDTK